MPLPSEADIAIVGAGAAGLMAAITAARVNVPDCRALLLDARPKIGAKILISGGTRCNVTNVEVRSSDYEGGPKHFLRHVFEAFTPADTISFFDRIGVKLVLEPTGKYFPTTHSGRTVLEALLKEASAAGVRLETGRKISSIEKKGGFFHLKADPSSPDLIRARRVVLATGGLSYPETGSDGTGFRIARTFGHTIVPTAPALTPLLTDDKDWQELSGVALPSVKLSYYENGKKKAEAKGAFLFTHFGFSGPSALDLSRHFALSKKGTEPFIEADFTPSGPKYPARFLKTLKAKSAGAAPLRDYRLPVTGVYGYKKAEVTAGGVDLKEVHFATMESRLVPGLYLAGEILDVDGRIGGFNFQWAWSTGALAGRASAKSLG